MDCIMIRDLRLRCIIGLNDQERRDKQDVIINIALYADLSKAGRTDRQEDTIDYRAVKKSVLNMVEASHYCLVEALAEAVANVCLQNPAVDKVSVTVDKPYALRFAQSVAVEITRTRKE